MRIAFCPYSKDNFYQRRLAQELEKLGATVEPLLPRRLLQLGCVATRRVEVLHIHWTNQLLVGRTWLGSVVRSLLCIVQLGLCRLLGRRIVWTAHNLSSHERRYPRTEGLFTMLVAHLAHRVLVHTDAAATRVVQAFHIRKSKTCVIPHAHYIGEYSNSVAPSAARDRLGIDGRSFVFLFLGNIRSYKGIGPLVDAFRELNQADARLLLAGRPFDDQVDRRVRDWVASDARIDYRPGFIEDDQMQLYFNAADVVVLPFTDVLTSGSLLLAMSFAKAVILPDMPVLRETVPESGVILYAPSEPAGLAGAMRQAVRQRAEMTAMGQICYNFVKDWGWPEMARATIDAYQR